MLVHFCRRTKGRRDGWDVSESVIFSGMRQRMKERLYTVCTVYFAHAACVTANKQMGEQEGREIL